MNKLKLSTHRAPLGRCDRSSARKGRTVPFRTYFMKGEGLFIASYMPLKRCMPRRTYTSSNGADL